MNSTARPNVSVDNPSSQEGHPSDAELIEFGLGRCGAGEADRIERHVIACDACCRKLESIPEDSLLGQLGARGPATRRAAGDTNRGLLETDVIASVPETVGTANQFADLLRDHPKYEFVREIGAGGMGVVYQAVHRVMNRMVALKVIAPRLLLDPDAKNRFRREVEIAAKLQHKNVVAAFDADEIGGHLFLVSEFVDGRSVDQLIDEGEIPVRTACEIAIQAAAGLEHAHEHGLMHRDVKPQNMLVSADGSVKVVDFGLASYVEPERSNQQGLTSAGVIVGTPDYLSPEQARETKVDHRADIYSLGCTLYHMLAGVPPFPGASRVEKLSQHLQAFPKSLREIRSDVPTSLDACVAKMMAKDPDQRYQSAREAIDAIESCFGSDRTGLPTIIASPREPARAIAKHRPVSRRSALLLGAGGLAAALGGAAYWASFVGTRRDEPRLLAVLPPAPYEPDLNHLLSASERLGIADRLDVTSTDDWIPAVGSSFVPLSRVEPERYDAVIFLGEESDKPTKLSSDPDANRSVRRIIDSMQNAGKPITSYCSGLWPLTHFGLSKGKRVVGCEHTSDVFKAQSGAIWLEDEDLVVDGDLITSSNTMDAGPLLKKILERCQ